jgi:hypothetical protein
VSTASAELTPRPRPFPALALAGAFLAVLVAVVLHHEPWRDEVEFWLMAQTSTSLAELRQNLHYANQTRLWPLLLYGVSRLWEPVEAMQLFHALIAAAAIWTFARYAPFGARTKVLFAFGYYPLFEYGAIARSYGLGVWLLFSACALMARARRPYVALGACLFLLAQTSAFAAIIAVALALAVMADDLLGERAPGEARHGWRLAAVVLLALAGLAVSVMQMIAPADGTFVLKWHVSTELPALLRTAGHLWRAYVPLPRPTLHFWNTNVLDGWTGVQAAGGLALAAAATWAWAARPAALVFHLAGTGALLVFAYISGFSAARHVGHLYLVLVAAAWLAAGARAWRSPALARQVGRPLAPPVWQAAGAFLLVAHLGAGLFAAVMDLRHPFSGGRQTAEFLRGNGHGNAPLVVDPGFIGPPVAVHLGRPYYEPGSRRWGFFVVWDRQRGIERVEVPLEAQALAREMERPVVLLSNRPIGRRRAPFTHLAEIAGCIVEGEQYQVYLVPRPAS